MVKETRNPQGELHSYNDPPTVIWSDGSKFWYKNGELHRDGDLPAVIYADGTKGWYKNGKIHRDGDLPAVIYADGTKSWYKNGKYHRDGDKPAIIWSDGSKRWWKNGSEYYPNFRKILLSITDEEEYVRFLSEHPELRTKPVKVVKYKRKRSVVRSHKRAKPRKR